ncbi:MAG: helix-turn-helix domain-containing protein [Methylacidiphilales bacterium]|nr:helix-turn-helix domain-containing protein [Candidatus Methylacidiphilales bacterium]
MATFNADLLLESLRDHLAHLEGKKKLTLRTWTVSVPDPVKPFKAKEIAAIRADLQLSQPVFAKVLNVPVATARSWESGRRKPTGAALRLLQIVKKSPDLFLKTAA